MRSNSPRYESCVTRLRIRIVRPSTNAPRNLTRKRHCRGTLSFRLQQWRRYRIAESRMEGTMEWVIVFVCGTIPNLDCIKIDNIQWPSSYETSISYSPDGSAPGEGTRMRHKPAHAPASATPTQSAPHATMRPGNPAPTSAPPSNAPVRVGRYLLVAADAEFTTAISRP